MNGAKNVTTGAKMSTDRCQFGTSDRCQIGPLPLKVLPIEDTNKKIPISKLSPEERFKLELLVQGVNWDDIPE
jgi:hypothetical protein